MIDLHLDGPQCVPQMDLNLDLNLRPGYMSTGDEVDLHLGRGWMDLNPGLGWMWSKTQSASQSGPMVRLILGP